MDKKLKVLFISSGNSPYGIIPFIKSQGESLKKEGVEIEYFTIKGKGIKGYLQNIKPLRQHLRARKYNIIHAHFGLTGLLCLLSFSRIPIVLSVMGEDAYGSFNLEGKRIKSSYFKMLLTQIALFFVQHIIVKSHNILKKIPYKYKSHLIPNGINFDKFKPDSEKLNNNNMILYLANSTNPRKNFKLVEKALMLLNRHDLKLINPYPIEHNQFPEYLNSSSVFVLTSFNEGSPNTIKEAMGCNIPVVSTDVGDVREVIGKTEGCYITSFKPEDVAEKIKMALAFGKRTTGRNDIEHLEESVVARKIIEVYKKVQEK